MQSSKKSWFERYSKVSLRYKLPMYISLLIVGVLVGTSVLMYNFGSGLLLDKSKDEMKANADRMGENLTYVVEMEKQVNHLVSVHGTFQELLQVRASGSMSDEQFFSDNNPLHRKANGLLLDSMEKASGKLSFTILDLKGTVIASSNPESIGASRADRDYYQQAVEGKLFISDVVKSKSTGKLVVVFATPILNETDDIIGICYSSVETDSFVDRFDDVRINEEGVVYIASRNGTLIYHSSDGSKIGQVQDSEEWTQLTEVKTSDEIVHGELDLENKFVLYSKVPQADWTVVVEDSYKDITKPLNQLSYQILMVTIGGIVIAIIAGILISRTISTPITRLTQLFKYMADGDLTVTATGNYGGELQQLATSFNEMAENNKQLLYKMNTSIETLNSSTSELEHSSRTTARAVQETSITVMEIVKSMNSQAGDTERIVSKLADIGTKVDSIDSSSHAIKERSEAIIDIFHSSNVVMNKLIDTSNRNKQQVEKIHEKMNLLADSSSHICNITDAISSIASQTNLLALNASIEAARAGEHGRGFGVVASEIRKLAEQSAKQSEEIHEIITETLIHVEDSNKSVHDIQEVVIMQDMSVEQAQLAFQNILNHVVNIGEQIKRLASEATGMKRDNDEVMGAAHNLSASGEEVLASAEEVTATVQEQAIMVQQLSGMVKTIDSLSQELVEAATRFKIN